MRRNGRRLYLPAEKRCSERSRNCIACGSQWDWWREWGAAVGFGLGSAAGQQAKLALGVEAQTLATVEAGANCPGHILRMRCITFAPGASIPMHSHKDHPEVSLITEGTLTNTPKGNP
ncbi:MAG TPA: hypothetical protein VGF60_21255 [Xanthobacteraceae bacterium]|jgi:quercetin dioxygenase-like cupin family protein